MNRQLFDHGIASLEGSQVIARDLPLSPAVTVPPRLLLGGGSDRVLDIAGRYADAYLWVGRPWLDNGAYPFDLGRALGLAASSPF